MVEWQEIELTAAESAYQPREGLGIGEGVVYTGDNGNADKQPAPGRDRTPKIRYNKCIVHTCIAAVEYRVVVLEIEKNEIRSRTDAVKNLRLRIACCFQGYMDAKTFELCEEREGKIRLEERLAPRRG